MAHTSAPPGKLSYIDILSNNLDYRGMTEKYMRPGVDNYNRLYYPMAERPVFSYMRYNPIHLIFIFLVMIRRRRRLFRIRRRSKYYLHMYGFKRRGTRNMDYRVRFNQKRRHVRRKRNTLAKLFMLYTNRALLFAFFMPWQWAVCLAFTMGYFSRNTRRRRERAIKQRLLFAPKRYVFGEQFNIGSFIRLWRFPRRLFQKVYWKRRWKHPFRIMRRRWRILLVGGICLHRLRSYSQPSNPTGHGGNTQKGVPGNIRRFIRDYTHPFQVTDYHKPPAWQVLFPHMMQSYQERRARYGQNAFVSLTEWKGHNVMYTYGQK